jgi:hypothetical protein
MKATITICCCLLALAGWGQTSFLKEAATRLEKALVQRDTVTLKQLLHKDLRFGHSNGWVEKREDVVRHLVTRKLAYQAIRNSNADWTVTGEVATLRQTSEINYTLDGQAGNLRLHVLQVWLKTNKGWQLLARQSTKLN